MLKVLIILLVIGYVFRRILFTPIPGSQKSKDIHQQSSNVEYTEYEELD